MPVQSSPVITDSLLHGRLLYFSEDIKYELIKSICKPHVSLELFML